jgi:hypothetical protein
VAIVNDLAIAQIEARASKISSIDYIEAGIGAGGEKRTQTG